MSDTRYARTLQRAIQIVGGEQELATLLRTSPDVLAKWLSGVVAPPIKAYLAALQLVTYETAKASAIRRPS